MRAHSIGLVNPLPTTLAHYQAELEETLTRIGVHTQTKSSAPAENLHGALGKVRMLRNGLVNARRGRRSSPSIQLWPTFGLLEPSLWKSSGSRCAVVIHDPVPLRRQFGFGAVARQVAKRLTDRPGAPVLIAHSEHALAEVREIFPRAKVMLAYHPVRTEDAVGAIGSGRVLVAGQFKPERDLELIRALGPGLQEHGIEARIVGRGWPTDIMGWTVDSRFVSEEELTRELSTASVLLLPYRNYFQSGIALRCLELGTRVVGERTGFLAAITGNDPTSMYEPGAPVTQNVLDMLVSAAMTPTNGQSLAPYRNNVDAQWAAVVELLTSQ